MAWHGRARPGAFLPHAAQLGGQRLSETVSVRSGGARRACGRGLSAIMAGDPGPGAIATASGMAATGKAMRAAAIMASVDLVMVCLPCVPARIRCPLSGVC